MNVSSTISAVRLPNAPPIDDLDKLALSILASYSLIILVNSASPPGLSCITVLNEYLLASLVKDEVEIVVQINGKVRGKLSVAANISREEMEKVAMEDEKIKALVEGKTIVKVVAVPKKLVNIVVK